MTLGRLEIIILSLLVGGDRTGYDVVKWLENRGHVAGYSTQASQVYRQMSRLEGLGWAVQTIEARGGGPDAKVYSITPVGVAKLDEWIDSPYEPSRRPLDPDFQVRLMFSMSRGPARMLELVRTELAYRRRHELYFTEADQMLIPKDSSAEMTAWFEQSSQIQSDRGHYMVANLVAWLESAEVRLSTLVAR